MKRDFVAHYTAILASAEIGAGSLIHGFRIPFGGHLLSLNQGCLLTIVTKKANSVGEASRFVNQVSLNAAILKSLAPAGKKLTPMLALAVQGALFSTGLFFGRNILGVSIGMILLSIWGFCQQLIIYYLFFGHTLFDGIIKLWSEVSKTLGFHPEIGIWVLISIIIFKISLAMGMGVYVWNWAKEWEQDYLNKLNPVTNKISPNVSPAKGALLDLLNPLFLCSLVISGVFLYFYESESVWIYVLRPIAIGYVFFWISRKISGTNFISRYPSLRLALDKLSQRSRT